jgi:hypothetical protein
MDDSLLVSLVVAVVVAGVFYARMSVLDARLRRIARLDAKLDALLEHAGIDFDPRRNVPPPVADALRQGKKIEAIKRYREATGADLAEAKDYVDELQRRSDSR